MITAEAVFGPPGTGKTTWLLNRVVALLKKKRAVDSITLLSHTRAAAGEILSRLPEQDRPGVSTIHSVAYRAAGVARHQVVDMPKIKQFMRHFGVGYRGASREEGPIELGDEFMSVYNFGMNRIMDLEAAFDLCGAPGGSDHFQAFCASYKDWKSDNGYVDFNDMLNLSLPDLPKEGTRTVLVDEAQDLTPLQWRALAALTRDVTREVVIVGDDDQSIYGWGGADPMGMLHYMTEHGAKKTVLSQSWRVPQVIHNKAVQLISLVKNRVSKTYYPTKEAGQLEMQSDFRYVDINPERDTLILYRTHYFRKDMEQVLIDRGVPYSCLNGYPSLFDNKYARGIRALRRDRPNRQELESVKACLKDSWRNKFSEKDWATYQRLGWHSTFAVPYFMQHYYEIVDLDAMPRIRMSTIHGAKGMEAEHVVLHAGITERVANEMTKDPDGEARVFYVGLTRAKQQLDVVLGDQPYPYV